MSALKGLSNKIKSSDWLRSGFSVALGKSVVIVANFLIFYILVRICNEEQYGVWILFTTIYTIFEIAGNSFLNNAIIKYYNDYKDSQSGVFVFNALVFCLFLTAVVSGVLIASIYFINNIYHSPTLSTLLWIAPLPLLLSSLINFGNCIEQANMKFNGQLISSVIRSALFILYLGYLIAFHKPVALLNFVLVQVFTGIVALLIIYYITRNHLRIKFRTDFSIMKNIARYGFFTFGVEVIGQVSNNIGQLISGALLSPAAVGIVNVANRVLQLIEIPLQSIAMVLLPKGVSTLNKEGLPGIKALYEKSSAIIVSVMLPFLLMLFIFSDQVVYLIAGDKFMQASLLLKIIVVYSIIKPFGRNAGVILNAVGKTQINFLMVLIPTAINLGLNYLLIKEWGVVGAPIATLIATVVGFAFNQVVLSKLANVELRNIATQIVSFYRNGANLLLVKAKSRG